MAPNYNKVMSSVRGIRDELGLDTPPIDPVDVARRLGVNVRFVEFDAENDGISGFYDPEDNAIFVNHKEYPLRQSFTIAHELGHAVLHREWAQTEKYRVLMRDDLTDHGEDHEKEANAFAAHLLVPRDMLDRFSDLSVNDLSRLFAVSVPMVRNRIAFEYGR